MHTRGLRVGRRMRLIRITLPLTLLHLKARHRGAHLQARRVLLVRLRQQSKFEKLEREAEAEVY